MSEIIIKIILTNIFFSLTIAGTLLFFYKQKSISALEILLYSLGLGPALTALLLYWLLFLFQHRSDFFYLLCILLVYTVLTIFSLLYLVNNFHIVKMSILRLFNSIKRSPIVGKKVILNVFLIVMLTIVCLSFVRYLKSYVIKPLYGHDVLVYGTEGTIYYNEKSLDAKYSGYYPKTGFSLFSNHAPNFPLLMTWEKILNKFISSDSDYYFKSLNPYYGFLIVLTVFFLLRRKSLFLALLGIVVLFSGFHFFKSFAIYHIDMYRIYFLSSSWIFLAYATEKKDIFCLFMLGLLSGFASFAHSIGAIIAGFNCLALFLFIDAGWKKRIKYSVFVGFLIMLFGGFHYFFYTFWGKGWIF